MLKIKELLFFSAIIVVANSCSISDKNSDIETIPFNDLKVLSYDDMREDLFGNMKFTVLKAESIDYMFAEADKIVYKNNTFYIYDWVNRMDSKVIAFDKQGNPVLSLHKRGRGPGEYLQITDFDVDDSNGIWIVDGQDDVLLHYSSDCSFIGSRKLPFEVSYIKWINGGKFFFGLSPWNASDYGGVRILLSDTALNIGKAIMNYDEFMDPNFAFPSFGFTGLDGSVLYHHPINDTVYEINNEGEVIKSYNFDFGSWTVPDEIKKNIELNFDKFEHFSFLVKAVYIDDYVVVGSVYQGRITKDFIIDRKQGKLYLQNEDYQYLSFMGVSEGNIIYCVMPGKQTFIDNLPEEILSSLENGNDVLALVKIDSLFK
jgi:hypothetical protein